MTPPVTTWTVGRGTERRRHVLGARAAASAEAFASGQATAADTMTSLQKDAEALLENEGVKIR